MAEATMPDEWMAEAAHWVVHQCNLCDFAPEECLSCQTVRSSMAAKVEAELAKLRELARELFEMTAEHDYRDPPPPDPLDDAYAAGWQAGAEAQRESDVRQVERGHCYKICHDRMIALLLDRPLTTPPKGEG